VAARRGGLTDARGGGDGESDDRRFAGDPNDNRPVGVRGDLLVEREIPRSFLDQPSDASPPVRASTSSSTRALDALVARMNRGVPFCWLMALNKVCWLLLWLVGVEVHWEWR
jgi:hypothetical protein